jgi:hypothetical protein
VDELALRVEEPSPEANVVAASDRDSVSGSVESIDKSPSARSNQPPFDDEVGGRPSSPARSALLDCACPPVRLQLCSDTSDAGRGTLFVRAKSFATPPWLSKPSSCAGFRVSRGFLSAGEIAEGVAGRPPG